MSAPETIKLARAEADAIREIRAQYRMAQRDGDVVMEVRVDAMRALLDDYDGVGALAATRTEAVR